MVFGMGVIFFLMLRQTEGLEKSTRMVANMVSSQHGDVSLRLETAGNRDMITRKGTWLEISADRIRESVRTKRLIKIPIRRQSVGGVPALIITTPGGNCFHSIRQFGNGHSNDDH